MIYIENGKGLVDGDINILLEEIEYAIFRIYEINKYNGNKKIKNSIDFIEKCIIPQMKQKKNMTK